MVEPLPFLDFVGPYALVVTQLLYFIVSFTVVFLIGRILVPPFVDRIIARTELSAHTRRPIRRLARILILFIALGVGFGFSGMEHFLTSFATIAAAGTLAIGFASQDVIANLAAGVFIYTDRPFRIDDWIEWEDNSGIVQDISLRVTRVRTFNNELLTVPNKRLTDNVVKNHVAHETLRIPCEFGIGYEEDIQAASDLIVAVASRHDDILSDPAPSVTLSGLEDSAVVLTAYIWIENPTRSDFIRTRSEYTTAVKRAFDQHDVEFPYPQRDLSGEVHLASPGGTPFSD